MKFNRRMVSLFFHIKRRVPLKNRHKTLISEPQLEKKLIKIYKESDDKTLRAMIKTFLKHADSDSKPNFSRFQ